MVKNKKLPVSFIEKLTQFIQKNAFVLLVLVVLLLSFSLRMYNFPERWGLGNDDARDVAIAQEALKRHELPLIGSFSSAGPFVFGPFFYWFIMGSYVILPFAFTAPWLMTVVVGVLTVGVLMHLAYKLHGKGFSLLVGILATFSPQLVTRSLSLGQHTYISFFTVLLLWLFYYIYKKQRLLHALFFGLVLGTAINFHYQALNLLIFLPVLFFLPKLALWKRFGMVAFASIGVIIGLFPLLLWDSQQNFANFRNIADYFLVAQHRLYVPNSWRLFIFSFLPEYWSFVIGGLRWVGLLLMAVTGVVFLTSIIKRKLSPIWFYWIIPFSLLVFVNRYYKGERSEGYLLYFLPFILLFTAYTLYYLWSHMKVKFSFTKIIATTFVVLIVVGNLLALHPLLSYKSNVKTFDRVVMDLEKKYPGEKFAVYDYQYRFPYHSQPLSILLSRRGLADSNGYPIGVICYEKCPAMSGVITSIGGLALVDLSKEKKIDPKVWTKLNPDSMYDDLIGWSKRHELTSTFSMQEYILNKLHLR